MVLVLTTQDVIRLVAMPEAIQAVEAAFRLQAAGFVEMPPRAVMEFPERRATHLSMPASFRTTPGALAVKLVTTFPSNPLRGLPSVLGLVVVHDPETGSVLALIEAGHLTALRTGATSGVATKHLARPDARTIGMIGAGVQAEMQLAGVCAVRQVASCRVFDLDGEKAAAFARRAAARLGITSEAAPTARRAVTGADVVVVATSATEPVLEGAWLEPGQHVNAIGAHTPGARELDTEAIVRARVVPDLREACLAEAGDLLIPIREGAIAPDHVGPGLGAVISGLQPGRQREDQITLFKSVGLALEDVAVADLACRKALAQGIGRQIDLGVA